MDVHTKLDEIVAAVEGARAMPMSASCIVNRNELLELVEDIRELLPTELRQAQWVISDRDEVVEEGRREAVKIIAEARAEQARLVSAEQVTIEAHAEAQRIIAAGGEQAARMRAEIDEYVDAKLATFEVALHKTLATVGRGRERLRGRGEAGQLVGDDAEEEQLPS